MAGWGPTGHHLGVIEICEAGGEQDVRRVMGRLRTQGEFTVGDMPWGEFHHAYGVAGDVPAMLRAAADPDRGVAERGRDDLWNKTRHQGNSDTALALAVPFLLRLATEPAVHRRDSLLRLAAEACRWNHFGADTRAEFLQVVEVEAPGEEMIDGYGRPVAWTWQAAREAVTADAALPVGLLADPEPLVRANAAYVLAGALSPPPAVAAALRARLTREDAPTVRISLVLACAQLAAEHSDASVAGWTEALWSDPAASPDVRFAAALAWLCLTTAPVPAGMSSLFAEVVRQRPAADLRDVPWHSGFTGHAGLSAWLAGFLC